MRCTGEGQQQNIAFYNQYITNLNDEQRNAFNIIAACLAYNYKGTKVFNIIALRGGVKTFLSNAILDYARGMGKNVLLQLHQVVVQHTVHSEFPFQSLNTSTCSI